MDIACRQRRKRKLTHKERLRQRGTHRNKYEKFSRAKPYDPTDKRIRRLLVPGEPGQIVEAGTAVVWHKRRYALIEDVLIPLDAREPVYADYKFIGYV